MKWKLCCILLIFLCLGCSAKTEIKEKEVVSIIEQQKNLNIAIHYPKTGIKKLDKTVEDNIKKTWDAFFKEYGNFYELGEGAELNIDYTYEEIGNRYINITIKSFVNSAHLAHPFTELETYVYDLKQNKLLTIEEILPKEKWNSIIPILQQKLIEKYKQCIDLDSLKKEDFLSIKQMFTISKKGLIFYYPAYELSPGYCGILQIEIPFTELKLALPTIKETAESIILPNTPVIRVIDPKKKAIALTFDDGPSNYTKDILKLLRENESSATFFVLGNKVEIYQKTIRQMYEDGNQIGNHSYNHKWLTKLSKEEQQEQITKTQEVIHKVTGEYPSIVRPTYGSINEKLRKNLNLKVIMWTMDTRDWEMNNSKKIAENALAKIKDGDIIIMHDTKKRTLEALKIMIPKLKEEGFQLVTVSELEQIKLLKERQNE